MEKFPLTKKIGSFYLNYLMSFFLKFVKTLEFVKKNLINEKFGEMSSKMGKDRRKFLKNSHPAANRNRAAIKSCKFDRSRWRVSPNKEDLWAFFSSSLSVTKRKREIKDFALKKERKWCALRRPPAALSSECSRFVFDGHSEVKRRIFIRTVCPAVCVSHTDKTLVRNWNLRERSPKILSD